MKRSKLMGEPLDVSVGLTSVTLGVTKSWREGEARLGVSRDFLKSGYFACTICCKSFGVFGVATHEVDISIIIQAELFGGSSFVALRFSVFLAAKRKACRAFFSWGFYHPSSGSSILCLLEVFLKGNERTHSFKHLSVDEVLVFLKMKRSKLMDEPLFSWGKDRAKLFMSREDVSTFFSIPWGNPYFRIAGAKFCSNAKPESEIEEVFFSDCLYPFFIFRFIVKLEGYDIDYRGRKSGRRPRKGIVHDAGHVLMSFLIQDNIIECRRRVRRCLVSKVFEKDGEFSLSSFDESRVLLSLLLLVKEVLMRSGAFIGAAVAYVIFIVGGVFDDDVASPGSKVRVVTTEVSIEERTIPSAGVSISTLRYFELKMIGWVGIVRENFSSYFDPEVT
ncbi:unnamed protein product [Polarella glacialis]|uniref:Uncharacterized protein n=1 Tax=Polarella glacialis TaxID=89957 RepID=A0A813KRX5_POLGL|nr:unnamed protein product [Polarella glacialis]